MTLVRVIQEYRSPSRLNAVMLFYDVLMFVVRKSEIDARLAMLVGGWPRLTLLSP